ncbi:single-stranded-DNA-specific exonuclease RecJ, partial [Klebsiella pneumoniae]|nr:single-stranded-DNA-specific exonuclease RecJ [Klebsiella pneumoniae]
PYDLFLSKNLAGVGVIFYVMLALRSYLREKEWFLQQAIPEPNMAQFLDLVALGTVADVVSLDSNNRVLVHQGLSRIRQGKVRPGIKA